MWYDTSDKEEEFTKPSQCVRWGGGGGLNIDHNCENNFTPVY